MLDADGVESWEHGESQGIPFKLAPSPTYPWSALSSFIHPFIPPTSIL